MIRLAEGFYEQFDEDGNASYFTEKEGKTEPGSEKEFSEAFETYKNATVVSFHYGASDAAGN